MNIKEFITEQQKDGISLFRLAKVLEITYPAMNAHFLGTAKRVNTKLAKTIYTKFDIVLDGFIVQELK